MYILLPPLAAEKMFDIRGVAITNSYINSTIALVLFLVFAVFISLAIKKYYSVNKVPRGLLNFFEGLLEFVLKQMDGVTKDRKKSLKFLPIIGTLFFFIVLSNWMGLLPGTGSIGIYQMHHGELALIPLLRPANTDLNMTVAMAVLTVVSSHILGAFALGFFKYLNKYIKFADIFKALKTMNPIKILSAGVEFFVGILETVAEGAKMLSLSLRLFGNIFAGEVLLTVMAGLLTTIVKNVPVLESVPMVLSLPFYGLELMVGVIQGIVFSMLGLVYMTMAVDEPHGAHEEHHEHTVQHAHENTAGAHHG
jgi:F-type H+-transporting ATPase subunit a